MNKEAQVDKKTRPQWKNGIVFPDEELLMVRPSLIRFCLEVRPAAKLLAALLYHSRNCSDQDTHFTLQITQNDLIDDMCGEVCAKTLHDVAVPALWLLGLLEFDESSYIMTYTLRLDRVKQLMGVYQPRRTSQPQLEKILIVFIREQLEKVLIPTEDLTTMNKKTFQLQLEKVLIVIRKSSNSFGNFSNSFGKNSNSRRGRKPRSQATSDPENEDAQNQRDSENQEENQEIYDGSAVAPPSPPAIPSQNESKQPSYSQEGTQIVETKPMATGNGEAAPVSQGSLFEGQAPVTYLPPPATNTATQASRGTPAPVTKFPRGGRSGTKATKGTTKSTPKIEVVLTGDGEKIAVEWDKARSGKFTARTKQFIEDANLLGQTCQGNLPTAETLKKARGYLFTSNPKFYRDIKQGGITLHDVVGNWAAFEDYQDLEAQGGLEQSDNRRSPQSKGQGIAVASAESNQRVSNERLTRAKAKVEAARGSGQPLAEAAYNWAKANGIDVTGVRIMTAEEEFDLKQKKAVNS